MRLTLVLALALLYARGAFGITIETVPVGDVGNANDPADGDGDQAGIQNFGAVAYAYNIGKYEVTVGQFTAFFNAVAATDTYGLFSSDRGFGGSIARSGMSGSYSYSVIGSPNVPVVVSWGNAARFANWLHNGQPTGAQDATTTEDGAYTLNGVTSHVALFAATRNAGAKWFITSENEWYKAAYYQPAAQGGDSDSYWKYPMRTNDVPYSDQPPGATPDNTRVGNFYKDDHIANGYDDGPALRNCGFEQNCNLTDVGAYSSSPSYYGTFDQGGNVTEWNEGLLLLNTAYRSYRGGAYDSGEFSLRPSQRIESRAVVPLVGFRVATLAVPEPSTTLLSVSIFAFLCARRRHRN